MRPGKARTIVRLAPVLTACLFVSAFGAFFFMRLTAARPALAENLYAQHDTRGYEPAGIEMQPPSGDCGPAWRLVDGLNPDPSLNILGDVDATSSTDVWAVGYHANGSDPPAPIIEHWAGSAWELSPGAVLTYSVATGVSSLAPNDVWVVGTNLSVGPDRGLMQHWDGASWSITPNPYIGSSEGLFAIKAVSHDDVWAVGYYNNAGRKTLIEHWGGASWSIVPSPNVEGHGNQLKDVAGISEGDAWAVGYYYDGQTNKEYPLAVHWDGISWSMSQVPAIEGALFGVDAGAASDVWAVGRSNGLPLFLHWDGTAWTHVSSPIPGDGYNVLYDVTVVSSTDAWAVGYYFKEDDSRYDLTLTMHWDGTEWSQVPSPSPALWINSLNGVKHVSGSDVWAVGEQKQDTSSPFRTIVMHYTDIACSPTPTVTGTPPTFTSTPTTTPISTPTACSISFIDVTESDYFYKGVRYLYCRGVVSGYPDNTYRPYSTTTRGQVAKVVVLAWGWPLQDPQTPTFSDVPRGSTFYQYVETAAYRSIIQGYDDGTFRPGNEVSRGQVSKMVALSAGWALLDPPNPTFTDVPPGSTFYRYVETAHAEGIIQGYNDGTFRPGNSATRGQIAKIVHLALVGEAGR
ncbi:MAG: S-layer homology domain-containing protein [Chloroflexia bacterium]